MNKFLTLLLAATLVGGMSACNTKPQAEENETVEATVETTATETEEVVEETAAEVESKVEADSVEVPN